MPVFRFIKTYRSLKRLREIVTVLSRHGFGHLFGRLGLRKQFPTLFARQGPELPVRFIAREETIAHRLRLALQDLGPAFVKFGQILSGRPDMVPMEFIREFEKLQDQVEPFPAEEAREVLEAEIGGSLTSAFQSLDSEAIASGSIGQAHRARLRDGTEVILKIRRPDVERTILTDLYILHYLAEVAERYLPEIRVFRPAMMIDELGRSLRKEIDFLNEASTTTKFFDLFAGRSDVRAPRVYWDLSSCQVLVLERLPGRSIGDDAFLTQHGIDRRRLAADLAAAFMTQYFDVGLFHADPHPGNILVSESGSIGLIDYGMVGVLSPQLKRSLGSVVLALVRGDVRRILEIAAEIGILEDDAPFDDIEPELSDYIDKYFGVPLDRIETAELFTELMRIVQKHHCFVPRDFVLLGKSLVTIIGVCQALDSQFNLAEAARPHFTRLILSKLDPRQWSRILGSNLWNFYVPIIDLPRELRLVLRRIHRQQLTTHFRDEQLEAVTKTIARASNRLGLSIVLASVILASAVYLEVLGLGSWAWVGFAISGVLTVILTVGILRSGQV